MTGLVTLGSKVGKAVGSWASDLVFKPSVWAGFAVLAVSALLYAGSRFAAGRRKEKGKGGGQGRAAVAPASAAPALPKSKRAQATSDLSDFSDVEEILKRRGI
jgi:hypothetical protein